MSARKARAGGDAPSVSNIAARKTPSFTLGDLLSTLTVIDAVCSPRGLDVPVRETVIHDPASPPPLDAGALVLGVGADAATYGRA